MTHGPAHSRDSILVGIVKETALILRDDRRSL